ncbi:MAG: tetratricopeptide repeat protein [Candidatus Aminicenantales bacterium]
MAKLDEVIKLLQQGQLDQARSLLEEMLEHDSKNIDALYNLGMCYTELGFSDKAITILKKCVELNPNFSNAQVALGFAFEKSNDSKSAEKHFLDAIKIDPNNSYALRNLGGLYGKLFDLEKSIYYLERSFRINPSDPMTIYGLGYVYQRIEDYERADQYFKKLLELDAPEKLKELARTARREIAISNFKSKGFRIDAVFYLLDSIQLFAKKRNEEIRNISFEIAQKGREGLDINNPDKKYRINFLEGEYTGLQLVCYMFAGFQIIDPSMDIGIDLSKEYRFAKNLFSSEVVH